nr:uncharacterized protein CTRU02_10650 [Colletotrichum truncatum]KAF6786951.1 hypothetical protein CTRU02_10650 [Colletotrichum truncatum]
MLKITGVPTSVSGGDGVLALVELDRSDTEDDVELVAVDALAVNKLVDEELAFGVGSDDMNDDGEVVMDTLAIAELPETEIVPDTVDPVEKL